MNRFASARWPLKRVRIHLLWPAILCGIGLLISASSVSMAQQPPSSEYDPAQVTLPEQPPIAALGRTTFQENCAPCHGEQGAGDGPTAPQLPAPPPSFIDRETIWERSPAEYFHITKYGRIQNLMPPWQNQLTDDQIWQAVYYAWSLHTDQQTVEAGQQLYDAALTSATDNAQEALAVLLGPESLPFLTQSELASEMQAVLPASADWTENEFNSVLDYVRTLQYIPPWQSAFRAGDGVVEGQIALVTGGEDSSNREPLAAQPVSLYAYSGFDLIETFEGQTDTEGRFRFEDLSTDAGLLYIAETAYKEINFGSELMELSAESPTATMNIDVYESTQEDPGVYVDRANWVLDTQPGFVVVGLILTFGNDSNLAFVGNVPQDADDSEERPVTVSIPLPDGATDIQFQDGVLGGRYRQIGNRIYDTVAVTPGEATSRIFLSYRLPVTEEEAASNFQMTQEFPYAINRLNLLVADLPDVEADVSGLEFLGDETVQGFAYRLWGGESLEPNSYQITLAGLIPPGGVDPRGESVSGDGVGAAATTAGTNPAMLQPVVPLAMGGLLLLILAGVMLVPLRRAGTDDANGSLQSERDRLIRRIAQIDDQHALDQIDSQHWARERAQLKSRLLDISGQLATPPTDGAHAPDTE